MRKPLLAVAATLLLTGAPMFTSAYADTSTTDTSAATTATDPSTTSTDSNTPTDNSTSDNSAQAGLHGMQGDVLRPGADPNDPNQYAFLPPDMPPPTPGIRNRQPHPPSTDLTNIAIAKPYTIGAEWPDPLFQSQESNYKNTGQLTNGTTASLSFSDKGWVGFSRQYGRSVVVNLGIEMNIRRLSLDFLQNLGAGIDFPDSVTYYASDDGVNWYTVGTAWSQQGGGDYTPQSQSFDVDTNVNAQYIRAQFNAKVWAFADEFAVFGTTQPAQGAKPLVGNGQDLTQVMGSNFLVDPNAPGVPSGPSGKPAITPPPGQGKPYPDGYLTADNPVSGGVKNMQLVYAGAPHDTPTDTQGRWTVSDFLPMIAQEVQSGNPKGWLFDSTLFLPYTTFKTGSSWSAWVNELFTPNISLSALDQAVGQLKQQLNNPNFQEKVVIAIPTVPTTSSFGAIDSSGQNIDTNPADVGWSTAAANKLQVIHWFMQQIESQWNTANFANLQLVGFYWNNESVNAADPTDPQVIQATADAVHRDHLNFYWIPYYGANGIENWRQLGFDDVMIQPNVSFNWSINPQLRLQSTAVQAQYYHTGLEIEAHWFVTSATKSTATTAQNKYNDYFTAGNAYGFEGNVEKSYYLNSKTLVTAFQSTNPFYHQVYDNTVTFVNGQWTATAFQ